MSYMAVAYGMFAFTLLQMLEDLYKRFDIDVDEGSVCERRWISWGTVKALDKNCAHDFRYFMMILPLRKWEQICYQREWCWHELAIRKFAGKWGYYWTPA